MIRITIFMFTCISENKTVKTLIVSSLFLSLNFDGFGYRFAHVAHGGAWLGGFKGGVRTVRPRDGQVGVVVWDVGVGTWLSRRRNTTR